MGAVNSRLRGPLAALCVHSLIAYQPDRSRRPAPRRWVLELLATYWGA